MSVWVEAGDNLQQLVECHSGGWARTLPRSPCEAGVVNVFLHKWLRCFAGDKYVSEVFLHTYELPTDDTS